MEDDLDLDLGRGRGRAAQGGAGTRDPGLNEKHWKLKPNQKSPLSEGPAPDQDPGPGQSLAIVPGLGLGPGRTRLKLYWIIYNYHILSDLLNNVELD